MGSNFRGLRPLSEGAVTWERVDAEQRKPGFCNSLVQGNFRKCYLEVTMSLRTCTRAMNRSVLVGTPSTASTDVSPIRNQGGRGGTRP